MDTPILPVQRDAGQVVQPTGRTGIFPNPGNHGYSGHPGGRLGRRPGRLSAQEKGPLDAREGERLSALENSLRLEGFDM